MAERDMVGERRRTPRVTLPDGIECRIELRSKVRIVDISLSGALIESDLHVPVGTRAHLKSGIGGSAFASDVQIRGVADEVGRGLAVALGAIFLAMDERSRRVLEAFLKKTNEQAE